MTARKFEMINTLIAHQIRRVTNHFVLGITGMAVACTSFVLTSATANAVISNYSCSAGGFTGTIIIDHIPDGEFLGLVNRINYQINKGKESGGNSANVYYTDHGYYRLVDGKKDIPSLFLTGDDAIQDNKQHFLGDSYYASYDSIFAKFVFDKSFAPDPSCTIRIQ